MPATGTPHTITTLTVYPWTDGCGCNLVCEQVRITPTLLAEYDVDDPTRYYRIPQGTPLVEVLGMPNTFAPPLTPEQQQENCDNPLTKPHATLILATCIEVNGEGIVRECICCHCPDCSRDEACGWKCGEFRVQDLNRDFMFPTTFRPEQYVRGDWQSGLVRL